MASEEAAGSPWAELLAGASVVYQQAIDRLPVPALILELPSRRVRAANEAVADLFAMSCDEMLGKRNDELAQFDDLHGMLLATEAVASGAIDGYRARRRITARDGSVRDALVWCRVVELDGVRFAAFLINPLGSDSAGDGLPDPPVAWVGPLIVGTVDAQWVVERVSSDVEELTGWDSLECMGRYLLDDLHPDDIGPLLEVLRDPDYHATLLRAVRLRHRDGHWVPLQGVFFCLSPQRPSRMAFAMMPEHVHAASPPDERVAELERRLKHIAAELRAIGVMDDIDTLPSSRDFPQLGSLGSRQWQILVRLLRGERVPTIARELYLSQGTVRNHLTAIFQRFDVHSQAELIALLRRR